VQWSGRMNLGCMPHPQSLKSSARNTTIPALQHRKRPPLAQSWEHRPRAHLKRMSSHFDSMPGGLAAATLSSGTSLAYGVTAATLTQLLHSSAQHYSSTPRQSKCGVGHRSRHSSIIRFSPTCGRLHPILLGEYFNREKNRVPDTQEKKCWRAGSRLVVGANLRELPRNGEIETSTLNCLYGLGPGRAFQNNTPIKASVERQFLGISRKPVFSLVGTEDICWWMYQTSQARHIKASRFRSFLPSWLQSRRQTS